MIEAVAGFVAGAALTVVAGLRLVGLNDGDEPRAARAEPAADPKKARAEVVRAFKPLDLGPDPVRWPSQQPWQLLSTLKEPAWPSAGWDDEHFGKHRAPPPPAAPAQPQSRGKKKKAAAESAPPAPEPRAEPRPQPEARRPANGPPDAAELEHLVATQGLAATVNVIMQRTGWEFREAAQYLAKVSQRR